MSPENEDLRQVISEQNAELERLDNSRENRVKKAQLYLDLGDNYEIIGERDKALNCYKESLILSRELNEIIIIAKAYQRMGNIKADMFLFPTAIAYYEKAITISERIFNDELLGELFCGLGGIYHRIGANDRAIEYFNKSAEKANLIKDTKTIIKDYNQLGVMHAEKGDFKNALYFWELALDRLRIIDDQRTKAKVLNNIGMLYYDKGEYEKAIERFEELKRLGEKAQIKDAEGRALVNGAHAYIKLGQIGKAQEYNQKGEELFKKLNDINMLIGVKLNVALVYSTKKNWDKSIAVFNEIFDDLKDIYAPYIHGIMHYEFGMVLKNMGKREEARIQLNESLESFEEAWAVYYVNKVEEELAKI
ncbi:MAG: tetratricopeptide repeat protein [Thermoplasmata archaeon]|nr:MAG: tetratricopeptide repeat protein [Thermoplasmata archaeon]